MKMKYGAVINGDLIKSSQMSIAEKDSLLIGIKEYTEYYIGEREDLIFQVYRGDSFQIILKNPWFSFPLSIALRAYCRFKGQDVRVSGAVSNIDRWPSTDKQAEGKALVLSGDGLDMISFNKENYLFQIDIPGGEGISAEFKVHSLVLDDVISHWTRYQAYVIRRLIEKEKQRIIAAELGIKQQSVSRIKKSAKWHIIEAMIERYRHIDDYTIKRLP